LGAEKILPSTSLVSSYFYKEASKARQSEWLFFTFSTPLEK